MKEKIRKLSEFPIGSRLLYRAKDDWRTAVISKFDDKKVTLIVCSPTGRTYRLRRDLDAEVVFDGDFIILCVKSKERWRDNFSNYDSRW
jgi:hypothetical protein